MRRELPEWIAATLDSNPPVCLGLHFRRTCGVGPPPLKLALPEQDSLVPPWLREVWIDSWSLEVRIGSGLRMGVERPGMICFHSESGLNELRFQVGPNFKPG